MNNKIPFVFGKIAPSENFCNRIEEKKQIIEYIDSAYSFWLFTPRRFGKSSLIKQVFKSVDSNTKTIYNFVRKFSKLISTELFNWKDDLKTLNKDFKTYFKNLQPALEFNTEGIPSVSLSKNKIEEHEDIETILNLPEKLAKQQGIKICIAFILIYWKQKIPMILLIC